MLLRSRYHAGLDLRLLGPELLGIKAGFPPRFLAQSTHQVPCLPASVLQGPLRRDPIFTANHTSIWPGQGEDLVDERSRSGSLRTVGSLVEIDQHNPGAMSAIQSQIPNDSCGRNQHGGMHRLMIAATSQSIRSDIIRNGLTYPGQLHWKG